MLQSTDFANKYDQFLIESIDAEKTLRYFSLQLNCPLVFKTWTVTYNYVINRKLRGHVPLTEIERLVYSEIMKFLKGANFRDDYAPTLYRGIDIDIFNNNQSSIDLGFSGFTPLKDHALKFSRDPAPCLLVLDKHNISGIAGQAIATMSAFTNEQEYLFPPGTYTALDKLEHNGLTYYYVSFKSTDPISISNGGRSRGGSLLSNPSLENIIQSNPNIYNLINKNRIPLFQPGNVVVWWDLGATDQAIQVLKILTIDGCDDQIVYQQYVDKYALFYMAIMGSNSTILTMNYIDSAGLDEYKSLLLKALNDPIKNMQRGGKRRTKSNVAPVATTRYIYHNNRKKRVYFDSHGHLYVKSNAKFQKI